MTEPAPARLDDAETDEAPPFHLVLPVGWVSEAATRENLRALTDRASAVLRSVHRPDLDARIRSMTARAFAQLLQRRPVRIIYPGNAPAEELFPLSIVVVKMVEPGGGSLDRRVAELVRTKDAKLFDEDAQFLCWETTDDIDADGSPAKMHSFNFLVAIPGTERREALLFTASLPVEGGGETLDDEVVNGARALVIAIIATFRWGN